MKKINQDRNTKLNILVSEESNFWHFIYNLTNWHFSVRPTYKQLWLKEIGPLKEDEIRILNLIEKVFQKYTFGKSYWGKIFLTGQSNEVWAEAEKVILPEDLKVFKSCKKILSPHFQVIWQKEKYLLRYWAEVFKQNKKSFFLRELINDLNIFFVSKENLEELEIILLIGGGQYPTGGANIKKGVVTLEVSWVDCRAIRPVFLAVWHELTHSFWNNEVYNRLVKKEVEKLISSKRIDSNQFDNIPLYVFFNEAIVATLFPFGYLANRYFDFPSSNFYESALNKYSNDPLKNISNWSIVSGSKLMDLSKKYIEEVKPIDKSYINKVSELFLDFIEDNK